MAADDRRLIVRLYTRVSMLIENVSAVAIGAAGREPSELDAAVHHMVQVAAAIDGSLWHRWRWRTYQRACERYGPIRRWPDGVIQMTWLRYVYLRCGTCEKVAWRLLARPRS